MKHIPKNRIYKDEDLIIRIQNGDKSVAKDVAQDSWTLIIANIESLKKPKQFKSWAYRIIYNKSLDYLRLQSKMHKTSLKQTSELKSLDENYTENEELKSSLKIAISNLPIEQNHVIKLFYNENYSLKQISEILNISIGTAKSRLFYAREKLKQTLKNKYYES